MVTRYIFQVRAGEMQEYSNRRKTTMDMLNIIPSSTFSFVLLASPLKKNPPETSTRPRPTTHQERLHHR